MENAARETGTQLYEINQNLLTQRERLSKNNARLAGIANKLEDESNRDEKSEKLNPKEPRAPGIIKDLNEDIDGFRNLNNELENLLDKLSRII